MSTALRASTWLTAWAAGFGLLSSAAAIAAPGATTFGRVPEMAYVVMTPDGNTLAWGNNSDAARTVVMFDLGTGTKVREVAVPAEMQLRDLDWADNETLLMTISKPESWTIKGSGYRLEYFRLIAADRTGGPGRVLLMADSETKKLVTGAQLLAWRTDKPKTVVMETIEQTVAAGWVEHVYEVDTRTGKGRRIEVGQGGTSAWVVDSRGVVRARGDLDSYGKYRVLAKQPNGWKEIHSFKNELAPMLLGVTGDGLAITALGPDAAKRDMLWTLPLDGTTPSVLFADPVRDVTSVMFDRYSGTPAGVKLGGIEQEVVWLDPAAAARAKAVSRAFPGRQVELQGRSEDGKRVLARVSGPSNPAIYYLVDFRKGTADIVGEEYPSLANVTLGEVRVVSYPARDGTAIPAYLTLPPGAGDKNLPLVVMPHGGPASRDELRFDWIAQFLATRGYAVLQPQFRGSTGFGDAYKRAGHRQWGGLMQDDVTDGVQWLIRQGTVDARRACIVGASYGGYAALAGAALTPELYACAVSINGVSDLQTIMGQTLRTAGAESGTLAYWRENIGDSKDPQVIEKSPLRAVDRIRAPILLLHGLDDSVVYIEQSEMMANALKKRGKPYTFVKLPGEDHWLSGSEARIRVLTEMEQFLAVHLQP